MIKRRASPLTLPWWHGMPFADAYATAASTPQDFADGALKDALDRALPELREAASRAGERRVAVLLTGQVNAAENGPWEWNEAVGEWARPAIVGRVSRVVDAPLGKS